MSARLGVSFTVAVLAIAALATVVVGATSRSAHATFISKPEVKLQVVPGLETTSHGQVVSYIATIKNTTPLPLLHVQFFSPAPKTSSGTATSPVASCGGSLSGSTYACPPIPKLAPKETATVTISWRAPTSGSPLVASSFWKVAKLLSFDSPKVSVSLLSVNDPNQAAGVQPTACTSPSTGLTLETYQVLNTASNPLSSRVCAPAPSLIASITESSSLPRAPGSLAKEVSQVCLAAVGPQGCAVPFVFPASSPATLTFRIDNASLPQVCKSSWSKHGGGKDCEPAKIRKVFHDPDNDGPAKYAVVHSSKVTITVDKKVTTIVVKTLTNGRWDFG